MAVTEQVAECPPSPLPAYPGLKLKCGRMRKNLRSSLWTTVITKYLSNRGFRNMIPGDVSSNGFLQFVCMFFFHTILTHFKGLHNNRLGCIGSQIRPSTVSPYRPFFFLDREAISCTLEKKSPRFCRSRHDTGMP